MHCVIETPQFASAADRLGLTEDQRNEVVVALSENPLMGALVPRAGGLERFASRRRDAAKADDVPIFLLDIYSKGERATLMRAELNEFKEILGGLAEDYRASVGSTARRLSEGV